MKPSITKHSITKYSHKEHSITKHSITKQSDSELSSVFDLSACRLCPRSCGVDRYKAKGYCGEGAHIRGARAALLQWEEPCLTGPFGSGAVFFSGCNLGCVFCQNADLANGRTEEKTARLPLTSDRLSDIFLSLQEQQAANINLVTPGHFLPLLIPALEKARSRGLSIPVVYNTGSYEKVAAIKALDGLVDVYLPDLKFYDSAISARLSKAPDYFDCASAVIAEMVRQCPEPIFADGSHALPDDETADIPLMKRGVIVRHLAIPGLAADSRTVLRYLLETYGNSVFISLMNQYTPMPGVKDMEISPAAGTMPPVVAELSRTLTDEEYDELIDYALDLGIENGFLQEGGTASESFIPSFDGSGITH